MSESNNITPGTVPAAPTAPAAPTVQPIVLVSIRISAAMRQALMLRAAAETTKRGKRVSVNTLIVEALAKTYQIEEKT
jgi:hypothetical protein